MFNFDLKDNLNLLSKDSEHIVPILTFLKTALENNVLFSVFPKDKIIKDYSEAMANANYGDEFSFKNMEDIMKNKIKLIYYFSLIDFPHARNWC